MKKIAPAVDWKCQDCGAELGIGYLVGRKKKDRKVVCSKCVKNHQGVRNVY